MNEISQAVTDRYTEKAADRGVKLRFSPRSSLPAASGDPKSLERALMAVVDNAIKFSPLGGDVEIKLNDVDDSVRVSVRDQGIGIAKENQPKIFDRFYHLEKHEDNLFSGIGLGLAITRQVLKQHNGNLELDSEPGKGSTFTLVLKKW